MKVGLIGLPQSGKTTLFQALTGTEVTREKSGLTMGIVKVPDERLERLAKIYQPKKVTHATIELVEAHAPRKDERNESPLDAAFLNLMKPMDAFLIVVRGFDELSEPRKDLEMLLDEMILADMVLIEGRLERDSNDRKKGKPGMPLEEREALERCRLILDSGRRIFEEEGLAGLPCLRTYAFLTARPILAIVNIAEGEVSSEPSALLARQGLPVRGIPTFAACAKIEAEIQTLPPEERSEFRTAMGVREPVMDVMVRELYAALGLLSFFTHNDEEARAWTVCKGTLAPRAAGVVHTDFEKGFIRAEVIHYDDFIALGSEAAAKKAGKYRLEGRDYVVQDGDIIHFRFNV